ncbi:MAG: hypothetical protein ABSB15_13130 [Bryobacteraceae bacterium]|jgi:hypothetical protein
MTPAESPLPFVGTWKLIHCETSHPELPYPKSSVTTFVQREDGLDYKAESIWSDGRSTAASIFFRKEGGWCPVSGSALADSVSIQVLDDGSVEGKMRKGESESGRNHMTVSADGQTMSTQWEILGPGGVTITWKSTAQRQ